MEAAEEFMEHLKLDLKLKRADIEGLTSDGLQNLVRNDMKNYDDKMVLRLKKSNVQVWKFALIAT